MPKEKENGEWSPDQPLPDKEAEEDAQAQAQFKARREHLVQQYSKPPEKKRRRFMED